MACPLLWAAIINFLTTGSLRHQENKGCGSNTAFMVTNPIDSLKETKTTSQQTFKHIINRKLF